MKHVIIPFLFLSFCSFATEKVAVNGQSVAPSITKSRVVTEAYASQTDYWFHDTWTELLVDRDYDGFASTFSIRFDVDTNYVESTVYALVYLGQNDSYTSLYTTSNFTLYGNSSDDELSLDIDLLTGYPARDYDILVELYDAYDNTLLTYVTHLDDQDLALHPLESRNFDTEATSQTIVVEQHGGSFSPLLLGLGLLGAFALRLRRQSKVQKTRSDA